jgi:hypothetical protein
MHRKISRRIVAFVFAALTLGVGGCGSRQFDVIGKVTYNGAPLNKPDGQIAFIGPKGEQVLAAIGPDGMYRATNVSAGLNRLAIYYPNPKAQKEKAAKPKHGEQPPPAEPPFLTPFQYGVADTSGLSVTVEKETIFDVDITGPVIP